MSVFQKMVDHKMVVGKIMINHGFSEVQYPVFAWNIWNTTLAIFHVMQTTNIRVNSGFYTPIWETTTHIRNQQEQLNSDKTKHGRLLSPKALFHRTTAEENE